MTLAASALAGVTSLPVLASSHREAPFITQNPKIDGTDFYMFNSYGADAAATNALAGRVTLIANYQPLQDPYGGPNYFKMDPDAIYEIHIDNNGDAREDVTFQFKFTNTNKNAAFNVGGQSVAIPLTISGGGISSINSASINVREQYSVTMIRGNRRTRTVISNPSGGVLFDKPVDNIGNKSIPDYATYANQHIYNVNIPNCGASRIFVGQRKDAFVVNLGETFDLINIAAPATEFSPNAESAEVDSLKDANVTTLSLEVPTSCLTAGSETVIGGWTTASVPKVRVLQSNPTSRASQQVGEYVQLSRLGAPLVNEVVIGLKDKDRFNNSQPSGDGQFATYVTNPTLPALVEALFGGAGATAPTNFPRGDLVAAFLTGINGLNRPANVVASEELRLNTAIPAKAADTQSRLGALALDLAGFPNGRRPGDDVVDIELRVAMGYLCNGDVQTAVRAASTTIADGFGCGTYRGNTGSGIHYTDGAFTDATHVNSVFPYQRTPLPGSPSDAVAQP